MVQPLNDRSPTLGRIIDRVMTLLSFVTSLCMILLAVLIEQRTHLLETQVDRGTSRGWVIANRRGSVSDRTGGVSRMGWTSYRAVVQFKTAQGREVIIEDWFSLNHPLFTVGQEVPVLYNPVDPKRAVVDHGWINFLPPGIPLAFALLSLLGGVQRMVQRRVDVRPSGRPSTI